MYSEHKVYNYTLLDVNFVGSGRTTNVQAHVYKNISVCNM
jgi:hypothetical protein